MISERHHQCGLLTRLEHLNASMWYFILPCNVSKNAKSRVLPGIFLPQPWMVIFLSLYCVVIG
jgi:hypothetical protein